MKFTGGERSTGEQRQVTGIHDEAGVQVQVIYGETHTHTHRQIVQFHYVPQEKTKLTSFIFQNRYPLLFLTNITQIGENHLFVEAYFQ